MEEDKEYRIQSKQSGIPLRKRCLFGHMRLAKDMEQFPDIINLFQIQAHIGDSADVRFRQRFFSRKMRIV